MKITSNQPCSKITVNPEVAHISALAANNWAGRAELVSNNSTYKTPPVLMSVSSLGYGSKGDAAYVALPKLEKSYATPVSSDTIYIATSGGGNSGNNCYIVRASITCTNSAGSKTSNKITLDP